MAADAAAAVPRAAVDEPVAAAVVHHRRLKQRRMVVAAPALAQAELVAAGRCLLPKVPAPHRQAAVLPIGPATARFHLVS